MRLAASDRSLDIAAAPTANAYARLLQEHAIAPWFPRCIDETGGFRLAFDAQWRPTGKGEKLLESQARQTLVAAELAVAFPHDARFKHATAHGFAYLRDVMWDHVEGGWFGMTDRDGAPIAPETKHLHGMAYALQACFAVHAANGDPAALALGREGFAWIDAHAHDGDHGGYFEWLARDGRPLTDARDSGAAFDHIGTPVGVKDANVHSDLLEATAYALARHEDALLRQRHAELAHLFVTKIAAPGDPPLFFFTRDWQAAGTLLRPPTMLQTASRLLEARAFASDPRAHEAAAAHLIAYALKCGWDAQKRALMFALHLDQAPTRAERGDLQWWGMFEALKALELYGAIDPDFAPLRLKQEVWRGLLDDFIDWRFGGVYAVARNALTGADALIDTPRRREALRKGDIWKDASHETRVLLQLAGPGALSTI